MNFCSLYLIFAVLSNMLPALLLLLTSLFSTLEEKKKEIPAHFTFLPSSVARFLFDKNWGSVKTELLLFVLKDDEEYLQWKKQNTKKKKLDGFAKHRQKENKDYQLPFNEFEQFVEYMRDDKNYESIAVKYNWKKEKRCLMDSILGMKVFSKNNNTTKDCHRNPVILEDHARNIIIHLLSEYFSENNIEIVFNAYLDSKKKRHNIAGEFDGMIFDVSGPRRKLIAIFEFKNALSLSKDYEKKMGSIKAVIEDGYVFRESELKKQYEDREKLEFTTAEHIPILYFATSIEQFQMTKLVSQELIKNLTIDILNKSVGNKGFNIQVSEEEAQNIDAEIKKETKLVIDPAHEYHVYNLLPLINHGYINTAFSSKTLNSKEKFLQFSQEQTIVWGGLTVNDFGSVPIVVLNRMPHCFTHWGKEKVQCLIELILSGLESGLRWAIEPQRKCTWENGYVYVINKVFLGDVYMGDCYQTIKCGSVKAHFGTNADESTAMEIIEYDAPVRSLVTPCLMLADNNKSSK